MTRETADLIREADTWLGNFPGEMRQAARGKPPAEQEELATIAAAIALTHTRLMRMWQRQQQEKVSA